MFIRISSLSESLAGMINVSKIIRRVSLNNLPCMTRTIMTLICVGFIGVRLAVLMVGA